MKLHLGCGLDKKKGYINCDISSQVNPDKIVDLEKRLPFKDNSIDEILANHVLEHIVNFIPLMHEFRRVCKKGAKVKIRVPFYAAWGQYNDPTHVRSFSPFTFNYFKLGTYSHEVNCKDDMFEVKNVKLNFGIGRAKKLNWIFNPLINFSHDFYCRFFAWVLPVTEIEYDLAVLK
ncbi:methyltransferase domain-containing protein [Methanococcoides sp. SA1]|nr:methyltransferase domain-containing protein [Methanococcoides sp. SA1]